MSFQDKSIQCSDCGTTFTFSAGEQEQFASRGYTNEPKRCPTCRQARKQERYGSSGSGYGSPRQTFRRYAPSAARIPKYPLNRAGTDQSTAAIATAKSNRAGKTKTLGHTPPGNRLAYVLKNVW